MHMISIITGNMHKALACLDLSDLQHFSWSWKWLWVFRLSMQRLVEMA